MYILFNIFGKTWNSNTQIFLEVLGWDNIPKIKYLLFGQHFAKIFLVGKYVIFRIHHISKNFYIHICWNWPDLNGNAVKINKLCYEKILLKCAIPVILIFDFGSQMNQQQSDKQVKICPIKKHRVWKKSYYIFWCTKILKCLSRQKISKSLTLS